jgi:hypothetical protein
MNRRGRHLGFAVVVLTSLVLCTRALALTELVPGLPYLRPTAQMEALRLPNETAAVVIDLRQVAPAEVNAANALLSAIKPSGAASHRLILALVAPDTASALRTRLTQLPHCLTVGCTAIDFKTDLPVNTSAEADQLARAALAAGASPEKLLVAPPEKIRFDEGELMREHRGTATMKGPKTAEAPTSDKLPPGPAAVTDAVMQRAVHIYLGLVALKKI